MFSGTLEGRQVGGESSNPEAHQANLWGSQMQSAASLLAWVPTYVVFSRLTGEQTAEQSVKTTNS